MPTCLAPVANGPACCSARRWTALVTACLQWWLAQASVRWARPVQLPAALPLLAA